MDYIKRKIHFFYLEGISDDFEGENFELLREAFRVVDEMAFNEEGRYQRIDNTNSISTVVYGIGDTIRGKIGNRRTNGLPLKEEEGNEEPLILGDNESLFEPSHFILYPPGILAIEYNFFGPRAGSIRKYLVDKIPFISHVDVRYIINDDAHGIITSLSEVYKIQITALAHGLERFGELDESLRDSFIAAQGASNTSERISLELWSDARNEIGLNNQWWKRIGEWLRTPENREIVEKFKIQGQSEDSNTADYFDLLSEKFVKEKVMMKQDESHRVINTVSAFQAINEAFLEVEDDIRSIIQ